MKKCGHCKEFKSLIEFWKNKKTRDGLNCWCKDCCRIVQGNLKNVNTPSSNIKKCFVCGIELIVEKNIYRSQFNNSRYICNECAEQERKENWTKRHKRVKAYVRKYLIGQVDEKGKRFYIKCNKRAHTLTCELCGKTFKKTSYHHWNDDNPENGIYLCYWCHMFCGAIETGLTREHVDKYLEMKEKVEFGEM